MCIIAVKPFIIHVVETYKEHNYYRPESTQSKSSKGFGTHFSLMSQLDREQAPAISCIYYERVYFL